MDYFKILNLSREPFSNSPEPEFFYQSSQHLGCLQQLELAIRLHRGLNVVMGEVGTGKTTLCRQLIRRFTNTEEDRNEIETHLLLDPCFSTPREFLSTVAIGFGLPGAECAESEWQIKEAIKNHLFQKGVDEKKTVVLIIDEGQKLPEFGREILREFLNYETNEQKLLQIVIFAQNEFGQILKDHKNFADRVNQYYLLGPLNFRETRAMIRFRLARAGRPADAPALFTLPGLWVIYRATGGYPRRIISLCHQVLLSLIIQNRLRAGLLLARSTARRLMPELVRKDRWTAVGLAAIFILAVIALFLWGPAPLNFIGIWSSTEATVPEPVKSVLSHEPATRTGMAENREASSGMPETPHPADPPAAAAPGKGALVVATRENKPPDRLGSLKIREGGTVFRLLEEIYGHAGTARYQAVIRANSHIADMNRVRAGETIHLPAVPAPSTFLGPGRIRVQIAKETDLEDAYEDFKSPSRKLPPNRLIPLWNPREGLVFATVMKRVFPSADAAREAIRQLSPGLAVDAIIMEKPEADTVFFAN